MSPRKPAPVWVALLIAALMFGGPFVLFLDRTWHGRNDFAGLYLGAKLAGEPTLYDRAANHAMVQHLLGVDLEGVVYVRPPHYGQLLRPLLIFGDYVWSYRAWIVLNLAALAVFAYLARRWVPDAPALTALSVPASMAVLNGQDAPLLLLALAGAVVAHAAARPVLAGLLLSLASAKFHLMLLVPLALARRRDWGVLAGGVAGIAAQIGVAFLAQGPDWIARYLDVIRNPEITPCKSCMPNVQGVAIALQGEGWTPALISLIAITALAVGANLWRRPPFEQAIAWAILGGLLLNHHAAVHDFTILLLAVVILLPAVESPQARLLIALIASPLPYFLALGGTPYNVVLPAMLFCAAAAETVRRVALPARAVV